MAFGSGDSMGLNLLIGAVIGLVLVGIIATFGLDLLTDTQADFLTSTAGCNSTSVANCGVEYNATQDAIDGVAKVPAKLPLIAGAIVTVVVIVLLVRWFRA